MAFGFDMGLRRICPYDYGIADDTEGKLCGRFLISPKPPTHPNWKLRSVAPPVGLLAWYSLCTL